MAILPATGTTITFSNVERGYTNVAPGAGANVALRGRLATTHRGTSSGAISLSSFFGGYTSPYNHS